MSALATKNNIGEIVILGDLTDDKDRHSAWLVNTIVMNLKSLAEKYRVTILCGNHDYTDPRFPFFEFINAVEGITFLTLVERRELSDGTAWFLPHTHDHMKEWQGCDWNKADWIFAHNTFEGATGESGRKLKGIPTATFPNYARVISGDIHLPQAFGPITYVGSPYSIDFGDDFLGRTLMLSGKSCWSIPVNGPQKRLVEVSADCLRDLGRAVVNADDVVKVRVQISTGDFTSRSWAEIRDKIRKWADDKGVILWAITPEFSDGKKRKKTVARVFAQSDHETLTAYGKARRVDERLLKTGKFLMDRSGK